MLNQYDRGVDAVILRHEMVRCAERVRAIPSRFCEASGGPGDPSASKEDASILSSTRPSSRTVLFTRGLCGCEHEPEGQRCFPHPQELEAENAAMRKVDHRSELIIVFSLRYLIEWHQGDNRELRPELLVANVCWHGTISQEEAA